MPGRVGMGLFGGDLDLPGVGVLFGALVGGGGLGFAIGGNWWFGGVLGGASNSTAPFGSRCRV